MAVRYTGLNEGGPSPLIWSDCPWQEIQENPSKGYSLWMDFTDGLGVCATSGVFWTITQVTSGIVTKTDGAGGILRFDSNGHNAANDGINAQLLPECWLPAVGKTLWFEARVATALAADQIFVGLCDTNTAIIASGALDESSCSKIGFYVDVNTAAGKLEFETCKTSTTSIQATAGTIVAAMYYNLGFKVDTLLTGALRVTPYIDNAPGTAITTATAIPVETLALSFVSQCSANATDAELSCNWVRIAQLR